jgi:hypothetical protein
LSDFCDNAARCAAAAFDLHGQRNDRKSVCRKCIDHRHVLERRYATAKQALVRRIDIRLAIVDARRIDANESDLPPRD